MGTVIKTVRRGGRSAKQALAAFGAVIGLAGFAAPLNAAETNLALSGTATATTSAFGSTAADAIDGDRNGNFGAGSVYHSVGAGEESPLFYQVDLGVNAYIDRVEILRRTDADQGIFGNMRLTVYEDNGAGQPGNVTFTQDFLTQQFGFGGFQTATWGTTAPSLLAAQGAHGRHVRFERIDNNYWLTFAEFEVYGSTSPLAFGENNNIARGKPVTTSSGPGFNAVLEGGNDGDINGEFGTAGYRPVYHSANFGPSEFWQVDLGAMTQLDHLQLFTRTDVYSTTEFKVSVLNASFAEVSSFIVAAAGPTAVDPDYNLTINTAGATGQYIRISPTKDEYLAFAELRAWAGPGSSFLDADFNHDTSVNGDDFNIWKGAFGAGNGGAGDADDDGDSDGNDFLVWQQQFGGATVVAAAGGVPEPASGVLAIVGAAAAYVAARSHRRLRPRG